MHLAAERGHTSTVEFLAGQSDNARKIDISAVRDEMSQEILLVPRA
jgi:hypothetical protein